MKAYIPLPRTLSPDNTTFLLETIEYYVVTQIDLLELDQNAAHFTITSATTVSDLNVSAETVFVVHRNDMLERVPVYGTKTDCENACKHLNRNIKEKALATIQLLSKL
jgi:hypothetical protein